MNGEAGSATSASWRARASSRFTPDAGAALFAWLCGSAAAAAVAVLPIDWAAFRAAPARGRACRSVRRAARRRGADAAACGRIARRLAGARHGRAPSAARSRRARRRRRSVLKLAPARIDPRKPLGTHGARLADGDRAAQPARSGARPPAVGHAGVELSDRRRAGRRTSRSDDAGGRAAAPAATPAGVAGDVGRAISPNRDALRRRRRARAARRSRERRAHERRRRAAGRPVRRSSWR